MNIKCYFGFHKWEYYEFGNVGVVAPNDKGRVCERCFRNQQHFYSFFLPKEFKVRENDPNWEDQELNNDSKKIVNRIKNLKSILK